MDANGLRFWMLADAAHWAPSPEVRYDGARRLLRLASRRTAPITENPALGEGALLRAPEAVDGYGSRAFVDPGDGRVKALGVSGTVIELFDPAGAPVTDLLVGPDHVLYAVVDGALRMQDLRNRWAPQTISVGGVRLWRLAALPDRLVALDENGDRHPWQLRGAPLPDALGTYAPATFRPDPENPDPPRFNGMPYAHVAGERLVAVAASPGGRLAVLAWRGDLLGTPTAMLYVGDTELLITPPKLLAGVRRPYSCVFLDESRLAVRVAGEDEAIVYEVDAPSPIDPTGDVYPLRSALEAPFLHALATPPLYAASPEPKPLHRLSLPGLATAGEATGDVIDGGEWGLVWHRLNLEAALPSGTGLVVRLAATETVDPPVFATEWHDHAFGDAQIDGAPHGVWVPQPSELPHHPGLLPCPSEPLRAGLFTALIQRSGRRVSLLRGRYLHVRLVLSGNGRASPEIAAVRAWGGRFSYAQRYLPELFHETVFPPEADESARATPADFLERFLGNLEGLFTPLEDRIANAHLLTHPQTVPAGSLEWLGSWVGLTLDPALPEDRRRDLIENSGELARWRGTRRGLELALDVVTDGAVQRGEVVVIEDWQLRRTFATILGADLADEEDPLTAGLAISGNSFVGETLFLGNEQRREFLALFDAELRVSASEDRQIDAFFERLAWRLTVLVQREQGPELLGLVRKVTAEACPTHVSAEVFAASHPLVVGVTSLVGVDTYLGKRPQPRAFRLGHARLGERDVVRRPPGFDPRLEGDPA